MGKEQLGVSEERQKAEKLGVVIFIIDPSGCVYTQIEEEIDNVTGKKPGEYSVICEKRDESEGWRENITRGINEETGIPEDKQTSILDFDKAVIWETGFIDKVWATVMVIPCSLPEEFMAMVLNGSGTDAVVPVGFLPRDEFENLDLRAGVRNILDKFGTYIFKRDENLNIN